MAGYKARPAIERFKTKVEESDGCWIWTGAVQSSGYGHLMYPRKGQWQLAHRLAYILFKGAIPVGMQVDHLCENKRCVNPDHLEAVAPVINTRRASKGNAIKTHCPRGHEFTPENTYHRPDAPHRRECLTCRRKQARDA